MSSSIAPATSQNIFSTSLPQAATTNASFSIKSAPLSTSSSVTITPIPTTVQKAAVPAVSSSESVLSGLSICSPEVTKTNTTATPPANIFASASPSIFGSAAPNQSIFGNSSSSGGDKPQANVFGTSLVKPDQSVFSSPPTAAATTPPTSQPSSAFGNIFNTSLSLNSTTASVAPTTTNIFAAAAASTSPSSVSSGNIFGSSSQAAPSTNIFGSQPASTQPAASIFGQSSSIFGQSNAATSSVTSTTPSSGSIFGQSTFGTQQSTGNIFGGASATPSSPFAATNQQQQGSIFGGNSTFGSTATQQQSGNIFGGSPAPTSSFGAPSIFSGGNQAPAFGGSATFSSFGNQNSAGSAGGFGSGGSIFSQQQQQPTFGGGATFGSPKANIFGSSISTSPQQQQVVSPIQSNNIFEQLGSQQSGNLFGSIAQATSPIQQQQQPPPTGVFSGSAFSSWR